MVIFFIILLLLVLIIAYKTIKVVKLLLFYAYKLTLTF